MRLARATLSAMLLSSALVAGAQQPGGMTGRSELQSGAPIPFRKDDDMGDLALKVALGLGVSIAIAVGVLVVLRRYLGPVQRGGGRRLRVLESVRLTPKSAVFLVEVDRRTLLIGQQGETLVVLAEPAGDGDTTMAARDAS